MRSHRQLALISLVMVGASLAPRLADADPVPASEPTAEAAPPASRGLQLGARIGYSLPVGTLSSGSQASTHLSDLETATVPIGLEAGFRFTPLAYLGAAVAWGPGIAPNDPATCPVGTSCFRQDAQLRVEGRLYFAPGKNVGWWMGFGAGWEVAAFSQSHQSQTVTATFTGPVLADLQIGFESKKKVAIGPYFGVTIAEFLTEGINPAATSVSTSISDPGLHAWITLGLRGSVGVW